MVRTARGGRREAQEGQEGKGGGDHSAPSLHPLPALSYPSYLPHTLQATITPEIDGTGHHILLHITWYSCHPCLAVHVAV